MGFTGTVEECARLEKLRHERDSIDKDQWDMVHEVERRDGLFNDNEEAQWKVLDNRWHKLQKEIEQLEKYELKGSVAASSPYNSRGSKSMEQSSKFDVAKRGGIISYRPEELRDYMKAIDRRPISLKSLQADVDTSGGVTVAMEQLAKEVIVEVNNFLFFRQMAKLFVAPNAESFSAPVVDGRMGDVTFTSELSTSAEDSDLDFEKKSWTPYPCARRIKVSRKLLRASAYDISELIRDEFAYSVGHVLENAYLSGSGSNEPLGCLVDSVNGISSSRDTTSTKTGGVNADDFITVLGTLKEQYRKNAVWIISRSLETELLKKKDGEGAYLLQPRWSERAPSTLLGHRYYVSEYMPTYTTGNYCAILGDFSWYWIVDALTMDIQVLQELYAESNQVGFICRVETDGAPALEDAFARLKVG
jgi:HK97 family phage major capsid protein